MIAVPPRLERLRERVRSAASRVGLFAATRILERELGVDVPIDARSDEVERITFAHSHALTLPASELIGLDYAKEGGALGATLTTSFLGLVGSESPLPPAMTEDVLLGEGGEALAAAYGVFEHRALSFLYRAWRRFAPTEALDRPSDDDDARALLSLVGEDAFVAYAQEGDAGIDPNLSLGFSDIARCEPAFLDELAIERLLRRVFPDLHARIVPAEPRLIRTAVQDRTCLGTQRSTMGVDASYGAAALDASSLVRVQLGPVTRETYEKLLPGGAYRTRLLSALETWLAGRAGCELDVLMRAEDAPRTTLGERYGATMGADAHYRDRGEQTDIVHVPMPLSTVPGIVRRARASRLPSSVFAEPLPNIPPTPPETVWRAARALLQGYVLPTATSDVLVAADRVAADGRSDAAIDLVIRSLDEVIGSQVDAVVHHPAFRALEARWRGLAHVVRHVPRDENIELAVLACSKDELAADFAEATEIVGSRLYATVYTAELGTFGGKPFGALLADMEFDASPRDVGLLRNVGAIAAMAHAPVFAAAAPRLLHLDSWRELTSLHSATAVFEGPQHVAWRSLREADDSRALGLLVGRALYRAPYDDGLSAQSFAYSETVGAAGDELLFGSPIYPLATRLAASFARHRTLTGIVGDDADASPATATVPFPSLGRRRATPPLEVTVSPRLEQELRKAGLMVLRHRTQSPDIFVASANSLQRPKTFGSTDGGPEATLSHLLGTKFPHFFLACRFAHYIKVLEREHIGDHLLAHEKQEALTAWLKQYVVQNRSPSPEMRARYPLRDARVTLEPIPGSPGWYRGEIQIRPHLRYLDRYFNLSVTTPIAVAGEEQGNG